MRDTTSDTSASPRVNEITYRPEVDGLRAVAVIPVVVFHAGFTWLPGGFIGVDVFFVISGYLITSIILTEQARGRFTVAGFYERRARRILPALFLMLLACLPFAWWWTTPHHLKSFAQSLVAATLFVPNVYFYLKSGYFEPDADEKPLLHTWSLGVEEQYYIVFPWLVLACSKFGSRALVAVVATTAVLSLALSEWSSFTHPIGNFYLPPTRAWELALGSLTSIAALRGTRPAWLSPGVASMLAGIGLMMILVPIATYRADMRFPGLLAVPPTLGTALVTGCARAGWVARLLSSRALVGIGLVSYSLYLWHQPLFAFARLHSTGKPPPELMGALGVAAVALAYVTWRWVERPFRDRRRFGRKQIFVMSALGSALLCAVGLIGQFTNGLPGRLSAQVRPILTYSERPDIASQGYPGEDCFLAPGQAATTIGRCVDNPEAAGPRVMLWGDSHAAHLYPGLRKKFDGVTRFSYVAVSACPPIVEGGGERRTSCVDANAAILERVRREHPETVILAAVWGNYPDWKAIASTIRTLQASGVAHIDVVGPVPRWLPSLPVVLTRFGSSFADLPRRTTLGLDPSIAPLDAQMQQFVEQRGATYLSPYRTLCDAEGCIVKVGDEIESMMQWDVSHLTNRGSIFLVSRLWP